MRVVAALMSGLLVAFSAAGCGSSAPVGRATAAINNEFYSFDLSQCDLTEGDVAVSGTGTATGGVKMELMMRDAGHQIRFVDEDGHYGWITRGAEFNPSETGLELVGVPMAQIVNNDSIVGQALEGAADISVTCS